MSKAIIFFSLFYLMPKPLDGKLKKNCIYTVADDFSSIPAISPKYLRVFANMNHSFTHFG